MGKIIKRLKKIIKAEYFSYLLALKQPIDEKVILLEAGQGKNLNGSMFAFLRELNINPKWEDMKPVFVVTNETLEAAKQRMKFYRYKTEFVIRNSEKYCYLLATAKYLITDNSFPPYMIKREGQIYLNTWHGTPLKTLGKSDIQNAKSLANLQKNYLMSDYALFPNEFTKDVFMKDYMLENIYTGKVLMCDYPRNSVFLDDQWIHDLRKKMNLENKRLIAYMPTWRGSSRIADAEIQKEILSNYFAEIDRKLSDDQIFYVNLHFLIGNTMDFSCYKHIRQFPVEYETYDFLSICDMLVTDYSSVFFDFAVKKQKIILFAYDLEDYMSERGTYFPITELPFPIVDEIDGLIKEINGEVCQDVGEEFLNKYCKYRDLNTTSKILSLLLEGKNELNIIDPPNNGKGKILVYGGNLRNEKINACLLEFIQMLCEENQDKNILLSFNRAINKNTIEFLEKLPKEVNYLPTVSKLNFDFKEKVSAVFSIHNFLFHHMIDRRLKSTYLRENNRLFYKLNPEKAIYFSGEPKYIAKIFAEFTCEKIAHIQHDSFWGLKADSSKHKNVLSYLKSNYDKVIDHRTDDVSAVWEDEKDIYYNKFFKISNIINFFQNKKYKMQVVSLSIIQSNVLNEIGDLKIKVGDIFVDGYLKRGIPLGKNYRLSILKIVLTNDIIKQLEIQNAIWVVGTADNGYGFRKRIVYKKRFSEKKENLHGPIKTFEETGTAAYFRQSIANTMYFTVRKSNITDTRKEQIKLFFAYYLSKLIPMEEKIILFEKESSRYEESASVLYEKLIDEGYNNAYFILDFNYPYIGNIPKKYRENLVGKSTFKHYLYFFKSKTFLGSESLVHAIDLRIANKYAQRKLNDNSLNYVFLQHGVMYMVSLDSESRKFFKPQKTSGKYRVVVSSEKEAKHFIELGGYEPEMIYISGLPKFDKNVLNEDADRIVIMPTWRPWEYNDARYEFISTKYYQMIHRIFDAIPNEYHDKVVILPHPLFFDAVKESEFDLKQYLDATSKYDDVLKKTKILITDYSSIAYDAFYRGANVIFYWEEKDECLQNYGPSTKLMLTETNAYGDICYTQEQLTGVFEKNYLEGQSEENLAKYRRIVEFYDGENTDRLIEFLKKDEII